MTTLDKAQERAQVRLAAAALASQLGTHVGSGYGRPTNNEDPQWYLIVWVNKENLKIPDEFQGYRVVRRDIPVAVPALG